MFLSLFVFLSLLLAVARSIPVSDRSITANIAAVNSASSVSQQASCFPSIGFRMPSTVPNNLNNWWCDPATEYAFVGFSYEITACQSFFISSHLSAEY
jgi:hypothetical protein